MINAQYNVAKAGSLPVRIAGHQRQKMYRAFLELGIEPTDTILDIGATSDRSYEHSNYLEAWYSAPERITAVGLDEDADFLTNRYPGLEFVVASGCSLPFADKSFDFVHSSAVIEHVGSRDCQTAMLSEAHRVARRAVFLTTPNRWFPVEFHTVLPLVHWLPAGLFRAILRAVGRDFFASERHLNLLSARQLRRMAEVAGFPETAEVRGVRLCGLVSNLLFVLRKSGRS
ncbi:MAG TPA: methyltransferase domain-containing protein [Steroidobacteraceae bacterium]|jgi:ubiquinone/menaquinone biosynthesis C-methylase UbiE|nr:methyltransferase domain-containing protein [Steroidobacteraceae bacterium]